MPKTVFLTGATGFIGGHVARQLVDRGDKVIAYVRSAGRAQHLSEMGCGLAIGDLRSVDAIHQGMKNADSVVHVAANVAMGIVDPDEMWQDNVVGTENILDAAKAHGVDKVVVVSSVDHFGGVGGAPIDETFQHRGNFVSTYEYTKHHGTLKAFEAAAEGLPVSVIYPGRTLGAADPNFGPLFDLYVRRRLKVLIAQDAWASWLGVEDAAAGIILALDKGRTGEGYILAERPMTMRNLFKLCQELCGVPAPRIFLPEGPVLVAARIVEWLFTHTKLVKPVKGQPPLSREVVRASFALSAQHSGDKARRELRWDPTPLPQVLERTLAWNLEQAAGRRTGRAAFLP